MDPLKRSLPGQEYQVDRDRRYDDVSVVGKLTKERSVITGAGACDLSRKSLLVESFVILFHMHATRTCRETPTPAPSQRTRLALSVSQRRSRRNSSAWYAFSRSTEPFPSGRSWRGTNWTTSDSSKLFEVVYKI